MGDKAFDYPVELGDNHTVSDTVDYSGDTFKCGVTDAYFHTGAWPTFDHCPFCGGYISDE